MPPVAGFDQDGFCSDEPFNVGLASAEVVAITGCASDQTSADVNDVHSQPPGSYGAGGAGAELGEMGPLPEVQGPFGKHLWGETFIDHQWSS